MPKKDLKKKIVKRSDLMKNLRIKMSSFWFNNQNLLHFIHLWRRKLVARDLLQLFQSKSLENWRSSASHNEHIVVSFLF